MGKRERKEGGQQHRSIPLSMLPVKEANGDQRPLSPPDKGDKDENANQTTPKPPAPTAATTPSTSRGDAAAGSSKTEATAKDPDAAPPFSCTPVYIVILLAIFVVLVVGAITTIIDMRPEFIYGPRTNVTQELVNVTVPP
ncbi:hypothetical protein NECAME_05458 [Necator americanus]|uniref:Uncharacterized protein n=1 Tax=Necator americanus TaxID=51031 RepID=W2SJ30_NECAM|nr:hypothetical protein NECAME_05458 [Necator americanus]ETN68866.1 hypothetical protein NECAME_05458 [Necator americanus]